ncbi:MAG: hypothetical protein SFX74_09000 [Fimbriimonadaceae bacterium]|nr:hypothetical protein [Fimbriimonadaceae bacterium]
MKRVHEDDLIALAFGEYGGDDAQGLRAAIDADPALVAEFAKYAAIRDGLGNLRHVPAMELSTDAILSRVEAAEVAPASFWSRFGWLWMPATAFGTAAIAYLVFTAVRPNPTPRLVGFDTVPDSISRDALPLGDAIRAGATPSVARPTAPTAKVAAGSAPVDRVVRVASNLASTSPRASAGTTRRKVRRSVRGRIKMVAALAASSPRDAATGMVTAMSQPTEDGQITALVPRQELNPPAVAMAAPPVEIAAPSAVLLREDPTVVRTDASPVVTVPTLSGVEVRG